MTGSATVTTFDDLVAEGNSVPVEGWDFSWFDGRATEERPPWSYLGLVSDRMAYAQAALDIQTGGGEVTAKIPMAPPVLAATESWPPNIAIARRNLAHLGATVTETGDADDLPYADGTFDLVISRHPTVTRFDEIARVLAVGGTYLSQQIGAGTNRELTEFFLGPGEIADEWRTAYRVDQARTAGLDVVDLREAELRVEFFDIAAVIVFLRKVIWTVHDFDVDRYRDRLAAMHDVIEHDGSFVSYARRFLIEAQKLS